MTAANISVDAAPELAGQVRMEREIRIGPAKSAG